MPSYEMRAHMLRFIPLEGADLGEFSRVPDLRIENRLSKDPTG